MTSSASKRRPAATGSLAYTSCHYRVEPERFDGVQAINQLASPAHPRGAFLGRVGPDTCILSLTGILGDYPPTDPHAFLEFVKSLPVPDIYRVVRDKEALDDPVSFRFPVSAWRHYDRQAQQAMVLREHLWMPGPIESGPFFADVADVITPAWNLSASGDLAIPGAEDAQVTEELMRVTGLVDPASVLIRPRILIRVLRQTLHRLANHSLRQVSRNGRTSTVSGRSPEAMPQTTI